MTLCLIGLGSNAGDRRANLDLAIERLAARSDVRVVACSACHPSRPVGGPSDQPAFLNAAARCETALGAESLLHVLQDVEHQLGRVRQVRWGPRTIDLDLLLFDEQVMAMPSLILPHPRMSFRRFVLEPSVEVAPDMVHPPTQWTVRELLGRLNDRPDYLAVTGGSYAFRSEVVQRVARSANCRAIADPIGRLWERQVRTHGTAESCPPLRSPVQQRAEVLVDVAGSRDERGRDESARPFVISDFWMGECIAAEYLNEDHAGGTERFASGALAADLLGPKLLVFLTDEKEHADAAPSASWRDYQAALRVLAERPRQCPVLYLPGDDPQSVVDEVIAAFQAMASA